MGYITECQNHLSMVQVKSESTAAPPQKKQWKLWTTEMLDKDFEYRIMATFTTSLR